MIRNEPSIARADMIRCALCDRPPCDEVCNEVKPAALLRSIWFRNEQTAAQRLPVLNGKRCVGCHLCLLVCPQRAIIPGNKRITRH